MELVAAEEVAVTGVAEAADMVVGMTAATAMTVTTEVAVTAEGRPLRTTEAEAAAGVTTGRAPDLIRHVFKIFQDRLEFGCDHKRVYLSRIMPL